MIIHTFIVLVAVAIVFLASHCCCLQSSSLLSETKISTGIAHNSAKKLYTTVGQGGSISGPINFDRINDYQWKCFTDNHIGEWKGVQTGYSPNDDDVADHIFNEMSLTQATVEDKTKAGLQADDDLIEHVNSFVIGEVRTDCDVCFDSERMRIKPMGQYRKGSLRSRYCSNCQLKGNGFIAVRRQTTRRYVFSVTASTDTMMH